MVEGGSTRSPSPILEDLNCISTSMQRRVIRIHSKLPVAVLISKFPSGRALIALRLVHVMIVLLEAKASRR